MVAVLLVDVGFGDLHSTKDPAMDLYIIQMSKLILQSARIIKYREKVKWKSLSSNDMHLSLHSVR